MLYLIIFALLGVASGREYLQWRESLRQRLAFEAERHTWAEERRELLNRIQAPQAAQVAAANEILGEPESHYVSEEDRIRRKAEAMGLSLDDLRLPDGWVGSIY